MSLLLFWIVATGGGIRKAEARDSSLLSTPNHFIEGEGIQPENQSDPQKDPEIESSGLREFLLDTGFGFGFTWAARFVYVRSKNDRIFNTSFSKWISNISKAPKVDDEDNLQTNFLNHPLYGAAAYLYYRAMGHSIWASALGSVIQSAFFEYAVEGLVETPSLIDLVFTPGIGVPLGIGIDNLSAWLVEKDNRAVRAIAYIINPMRMFVRDRKIGILNPLTGTFEFHAPFSITPNKSKAILLSYPFFLESPIPLGRVGGNIEIVDLDKELGDKFIFYSLRLDFSSSNNLYGVYIKVPFAGVNNVNLGGNRLGDGFELGNTLVGGKLVVLDSEQFSIAGGFEFTLPTAHKDNRDRLRASVNYRRDFPLFLRKSVTATPYLSAAVRERGLSLQGNLGIDLIANADRFEGDTLETRIKYGAALGVSASFLTSPSFFVEFNGFTLASSSSQKKTDLFLTPGVRLGKKYSSGFGLQIPLAGATADIAKMDFIFDLQARF